jgi:hypothetical protein
MCLGYILIYTTFPVKEKDIGESGTGHEIIGVHPEKPDETL